MQNSPLEKYLRLTTKRYGSIRFVDPNSPKQVSNPENPVWIATRGHPEDPWVFSRAERIATPEAIKKLVDRRAQLIAEREADTTWQTVRDKVCEYNCNVIGEYVEPLGGLRSEFTLSPSSEGMIWGESRDKTMRTVRDDKLMLTYSKHQRHSIFRNRIIDTIEHLLTVAAWDRLPELPQGTKFPVKKLGKVCLQGLNILLTAEGVYYRSVGYRHYWKLYYIVGQDIELVEV